MALVEQRVCALKVEPRHVLREQERLQVRRVVNGVRPRIGSEELEVVGEAAVQFEDSGVVDRVSVGDLRVHVAEGRDEAGACERARRCERAVEDRRADRAARDGLYEEVVRPRRAEQVRRERLDYGAARCDGDEARYGLRDDVQARRGRDRKHGCRRRGLRAEAADEVLYEESVVRRVKVGRMRQVVRAHEEPTRRDGHVLRKLTLDGDVRLVVVCELEVA